MTGIEIDQDLLRAFERGLNPRFPERSAIPARVLGYGEISTVLEIGDGADGLAYKRLPMFRSSEEAERYQALYWQYVEVLSQRVGLKLVPSGFALLDDQVTGRIVVYIVQERLPAQQIGHQAIRSMSPEQAGRLIHAALQEIARVFAFNRQHQGELEVGLDGQISNWAIRGLSSPAGEMELAYFDTSTPLMQRQGQEQLDPELFLRSAPSFLVWIIRRLFLADVLTRYYDLRAVTIDLLANLHKEQRPDLIPDLVALTNQVLGQAAPGGWEPISPAEVDAYYREDAFIWRFYLAARKVDRTLYRLRGKHYPFLLPERVQR